MKRFNRAQSLVEYGLILGVVTIALVAMQPYLKRGLQSLIKVMSDDYGTQGERVSDIEIAVKKKVYSESNEGVQKFPVNTLSESESTQTKKNLGDGNIRTEKSVTNTVSGETSSYSISADYSKRKMD
ncbi:MAG: hypothetical protein WC301_05785 [Candidatus Omnitrophota bacterium]